MKVYNFESDLNLTPENSDEQYMREALKLAEQAFRENEVPIGAIIVANGKIIGKGFWAVNT